MVVTPQKVFVSSPSQSSGSHFIRLGQDSPIIDGLGRVGETVGMPANEQ